MHQELSCHLPVLVPPRVAACTAIGVLTQLTRHSAFPTSVWLICIGFYLMPGKRSYVNAVPGCLTPDQVRRQARDRSYLPQPPPPPLFPAWEDLTEKCDAGTQYDLTFTAERHIFSAAQAVPPLSGDYFDTINKALGIIAMQSRMLATPLPPRTISLETLLPYDEHAVETLLEDPVSQPHEDAPFSITVDSSPLLELITLEDSLIPEKDISLTCATCEKFFIGEDPLLVVPEDDTTAHFANLEERVTRALAQLDTDHDLIILGNIQIEKRVSALEGIAQGTSRPYILDQPSINGGLCGEENVLEEVGEAAEPLYLNVPSDVAENVPSDLAAEPFYQDEVAEESACAPEPFTAAQHRVINSIFTNSFAGFVDQIIGKVQNMITSELQTSFEPVCCDLKNQMELLRNEVVFKLIPMQTGMKRYCFKRNSDNLQPKLMRHDDNLMQTDQLHVANSSELVLDQLHVENSSELVRYFEKLVEDEVSASKSSSKRKKKRRRKF